jgi:hypothetical protein
LPSGLRFSGIDFAQYKDSDFSYDFSAMKQETIVNRGKRAPRLCQLTDSPSSLVLILTCIFLYLNAADGALRRAEGPGGVGLPKQAQSARPQ